MTTGETVNRPRAYASLCGGELQVRVVAGGGSVDASLEQARELHEELGAIIAEVERLNR